MLISYNNALLINAYTFFQGKKMNHTNSQGGQSTFLNSVEIEKISNEILDIAKSMGASSSELSIQFNKGINVATRLKEVETIEFNQDKHIALTLYYGERRGSATSSDPSISSLKQLVSHAADIAKVSDPDPCFGLAEEKLLATNLPDLNLNFEWNIDTQKAIDEAKACETIALNLDKRIINSDGANISSHQFLSAYANSHGFYHHYYSSRHSKSCVLLAEDGEGLKRDYDYSVARDPKYLCSNDFLANSAVKKTLARLGARKISTRTCPVIFSNDISSSLLSSLISAISGGNIYRRSSFLLDKVGEQIFPSKYSVSESPYDMGGLGSSSYDAEGVQTRNNIFIKNGILNHYALGSYSARRLGLKTTANSGGVHNLSISHDDISFKELLFKMGSGLLVTSLMGSSINMITGDYSRGASGFWVEDGEIAYAVDEITIASNFIDMFSTITGISSDIDPRKATKCGSILIPAMTIAGK